MVNLIIITSSYNICFSNTCYFRCEVGDFDGTHSREFSDNAVVANLRYGVEEKRRHIEDEAAQLYDKLNQYSAEEESRCTYPFKRKKHVYFNKPRPPPDEPWQYTENVERYRYTCRKLSSCLGLTRRRVGRGGRSVTQWFLIDNNLSLTWYSSHSI